MVFYDEKKWKDDSSTQASSSDVANMDDLDGLDTDEVKNKFSYAKSAILGVMLPVMASTAGAMNNEDENIWGFEGNLYKKYSIVSSFFYQETEPTMDKIADILQMTLTEKESSAIVSTKKTLLEHTTAKKLLSDIVEDGDGLSPIEITDIDLYNRRLGLIQKTIDPIPAQPLIELCLDKILKERLG